MDGALSRQATTERGGKINHSEQEVKLALELMAINGGAIKPAHDILKAEGIVVSRNTLPKWRDHYFPRLYAATRRELGKDISEKIAGKAFERALQADAIQEKYLQEAEARLKDVEPNHLAKNVQALATAKGQDIEKARLLRNEPSEIKEVRTVDEITAFLISKGIAKRVDEIDGEAEEIG
jgi:hypothetical protein